MAEDLLFETPVFCVFCIVDGAKDHCICGEEEVEGRHYAVRASAAIASRVIEALNTLRSELADGIKFSVHCACC